MLTPKDGKQLFAAGDIDFNIRFDGGVFSVVQIATSTITEAEK